MKRLQWFFALAVAGFLAGGAQVIAEETKSPPEQEKAKEEEKKVDDDWLNTVWTQVDEMVKEEDYKLQETVTVAGVRGAEAEDNVLDKLYYKGGKRYPSQDKLKKAIETLKQSIAKNPKSEAVPKQKFFIAQCYEKLGQAKQAKDYYTQVTKEHPKSSWATKSQERLSQMAASK
mgnify:FL=1